MVRTALLLKEVVTLTVPVRLVDAVGENVGELEKDPEIVLLCVRDPDAEDDLQAVDVAHAEKVTDGEGVELTDCVSVLVMEAVVETVTLSVTSALCDKVVLGENVFGALADAEAGCVFVAEPLAAEMVGAKVSEAVALGDTEVEDEWEILTEAVLL